LVLAGIALTVEPESPDLNDAKGFLRYYFATAPVVPGDTWAHLTPAYHAEGPSHDDQQFSFSGYEDYFAGFSRIDVASVGISRDHDGWFEATLSYYGPDKSIPSVSHQQFQLVCPSESKFPFLSCGTENIRLNAGTLYPKEFWDE
jgi:hypothetical protein